jgi:UPF0755 protein
MEEVNKALNESFERLRKINNTRVVVNILVYNKEANWLFGESLKDIDEIGNVRIEAECTWVADYEPVSGVFHNRLASTSFNGRMDSDATIQYILRHTTGARKEKLEDADLKIDSPYNTRLYDGLPPGPICSPSLNALMAAILPDTESGYYYFVAQANGYNLYAKTYAEHLKNIETVQKEEEN